MTVKAARLISSAEVVAYHSARHGRSVARSIAEPYLRPGVIEEQLVYPVTTEACDHPDGYEGAMVKGLDSRYTPGARGRAWLKVKRATTVDLVVVAADRGYGRRHGWLSNYHLAARDEATGRLEPVGKTFKGLTAVEFRAMTDRLAARALREEGATVYVEPRVVVEVLFTDLQRSPTYAAGLALRFARIARIRDDKTPADADSLETIRALLKA